MNAKELVGKKVVIAPFNQEAVFVYHWLIQQKVEVIAFFDANENLQCKNYKDIPILPYYYFDNVVAIVSKMVTVNPGVIVNKLYSVGYWSVLKQEDMIFDISFNKIAKLVDIEAFLSIKGYKYAIPIKRRIASLEYREKFNIKFISVDVTNNCTLNCKFCCALMPYQQKEARRNMDMSLTMEAIDKIVDCVDFIPELSIIGGEPFLNPDLKNLLQKLNHEKYKKKIGNFLITTNGTIVPDRETLEAIKGLKNHIYIYLSSYGQLSMKGYELLQTFNQHDINCVVCENKFWTVMCQPFNYKENSYTIEEAKANCSECNFVKYNQFRIVENKIYKCMFLAYGELGNVIPIDKHNSLDLLNEKLSSDELKNYLNDFQPGRVYCSKYVTEATNGEREGKRVPIGEQTDTVPEYAKHE